MAFFIDKARLAQFASLAQHHQAIVNMRRTNNAHEANLFATGGSLTANDARLPAEAWRDFDRQTKAVMLGDEGGTLLEDLMPLARTVGVGKIVSEYRKIGDAELEVRTSIDGQHAKPVNRTGFDFDGVVLPVHSTQVGRNWRELEGMRAEGYDALRDDQEIAVRHVRLRTIDNFVNGTTDLAFKGYKSYGIVNNPNTKALNLGASGVNVDLTAAATTYEKAYSAFLAALKTLQGEGNNATGDVTFYVSNAIWFNLMRVANPVVNTTETMLEALRRIPGVKDIKRTDRVTGNAFFAMILSAQYVQPVVGMPVTTTPIARVTPMDDFHLLVWGVSGLQIKADGAGRSGVLYAAG